MLNYQKVTIIYPSLLEFVALNKLKSGPSEPLPVRQKVGMGVWIIHWRAYVPLLSGWKFCKNHFFIFLLCQDHRKPLLHVQKARWTCVVNILYIRRIQRRQRSVKSARMGDVIRPLHNDALVAIAKSSRSFVRQYACCLYSPQSNVPMHNPSFTPTHWLEENIRMSFWYILPDLLCICDLPDWVSANVPGRQPRGASYTHFC